MAKLPLIEIIPVALSRHIHDRQFVDASTACDFMIAKLWCDWVLYIRGRKYEWPNENTAVHYSKLSDHILHCIDTDIAFYGYD